MPLPLPLVFFNIEKGWQNPLSLVPNIFSFGGGGGTPYGGGGSGRTPCEGGGGGGYASVHFGGVLRLSSCFCRKCLNMASRLENSCYHPKHLFMLPVSRSTFK